jgi:release factor glutamine methyltransferase
MTLKTAVAQGTALLKEAGIAPSRLTAEVLLAHALGKERAWLWAHSEDELSELGWIHYGRYLHERLRHKPTQYITRRQEFYGRDFHVAPGVLIPRPETELLVEAVLKEAAPGARVIDIGTGSGCIAITLACEAGLRVAATDVSGKALAIAERNRRTHGAGVTFVRCDLGSALGSGVAGVVVSNPPYVADTEPLAKEVRDWEPAEALFAGSDGLAVYRRLIPEALRLLQPGGLLAIEIGCSQRDPVLALLKGWEKVRVCPDLAGLDRYCLARKPH